MTSTGQCSTQAWTIEPTVSTEDAGNESMSAAADRDQLSFSAPCRRAPPIAIGMPLHVASSYITTGPPSQRPKRNAVSVPVCTHAPIISQLWLQHLQALSSTTRCPRRCDCRQLDATGCTRTGRLQRSCGLPPPAPPSRARSHLALINGHANSCSATAARFHASPSYLAMNFLWKAPRRSMRASMSSSGGRIVSRMWNVPCTPSRGCAFVVLFPVRPQS
jgi:hypothetical protein